MTMPNFIGIGAAKGGTTALHRYLKQHPQIYMSPARSFDSSRSRTTRPTTAGRATRPALSA